ncbi:MAG: polynucleotide adenylyltransferase PcnB [Vicinamibacterales bacterium]|nr:polynucleotide adenylyltransferase PcnB [Vicinamibacterales bacterium]
MSDPVILARADHTISRQQIDSDALKVLYRLHQSEYEAYLVGGSVRDLLLGRRPKDFDIGTSAQPFQVKKLFRNCWIIGRRFRLAHVRFGTKNIEVATFRRLVTAEEMAADDAAQAAARAATDAAEAAGNAPEAGDEAAGQPRGQDASARDLLIHRDNTFGTPEEDAFRRDFTVNALFYSIADFSIIDYTGGLKDLEARVIRSIGDPNERFREDPVRMTRAVALAARLDFEIDPLVDDAIATHRFDIARAAPARLTDEIYKILRAGKAERTFQMLADRRLLEPIAPELQEAVGPRLWASLAAVDRYRSEFSESPDTLTNAILMGSLVVPLGYTMQMLSPVFTPDGDRKEPKLSIGMLPLARRDIEHLRQILSLQKRLLDVHQPEKARRALAQRGPFREALTWLEIHGNAPEAVESWRAFLEDGDEAPAADSRPEGGDPQRRRRRRRKSGRRGPGPAPVA